MILGNLVKLHQSRYEGSLNNNGVGNGSSSLVRPPSRRTSPLKSDSLMNIDVQVDDNNYNNSASQQLQ